MNCVRCGKRLDTTVVSDVCWQCAGRIQSEPLAGKITIYEGPGRQISGIVKALRGLADALETLTEVEG